MPNLLLVDTRVTGYQSIIAAAAPNVSVLTFDYATDTFATILARVNALPVASFSNVGIVQDGTSRMIQYSIVLNATPANVFDSDPDIPTWSDIRVFFAALKAQKGVNTIDFISCLLLNNSGFAKCITTLESQLSMTLRASSDETGNLAQGGNWVQESDGVNIQSVYFTSAIFQYTFLLYAYTSLYWLNQKTVQANGSDVPPPVSASNPVLNNYVQLTLQSTIVSSWGSFAYQNPPILPTAFPAGKTIVGMASSQTSAAAILNDGSIFVWGRKGMGGWDPNQNDYDYGTSSTGTILTLVPTGKTATTLISSFNGTFAAMLNDGSIVCWGTPNNGNYTPALPSGRHAVQITSNSGQFAAILDDGSVFAWTPYETTGYGGETPASLQSANLGGKRVVAIMCAYYSFVALLSDGSVVGWGTLNDTLNLQPSIPAGRTVVSLVANQQAYAAILDDGSVYAWGNAAFGGYTPSALTTAGLSGKRVTYIAVNDQHFAALLDDNSVIGWGQNLTSNSPNYMTLASSGKSISAVIPNWGIFLIVYSDTTLTTLNTPYWGNPNAHGAAIPTISGTISKIASSGGGFAVLLTNGSAVSWGSLGAAPSSLTAGTMGGKTIVSIHPDTFGVTALLNDGSVITWGVGSYAAPTLTGVTNIVPSFTSIFALVDNGVTIDNGGGGGGGGGGSGGGGGPGGGGGGGGGGGSGGGGGGGAGPLCFLGNAPVQTPSGFSRIDSLAVGDLVLTETGEAVPIRRIVAKRYRPGPSTNPYVLRKGQFGATEELLISPRHRVAMEDGEMVEARDLGLAQREMKGPFTYYNIELPAWANMRVAGVEVESMAPAKGYSLTQEQFEAALKGITITEETLKALRRTCSKDSNGKVMVLGGPLYR
jgi:hypothetical protein